MSDIDRYDEERLGKLLGALPSAPAGWVQAAKELPRARRELPQIVELARADAAFRTRLIADLEAALSSAGYEPSTALVDAVRASLPELER